MRGQRTERLIQIASRFISCPARPVSLTGLAEKFGVSKTVVSDDVAIVAQALAHEGMGRVIVDRGRSGGAAYVPSLSPQKRREFLSDLVEELSHPRRFLPAGMIYYADILFDPSQSDMLGLALASDFAETNPTIVMTSEVKGIPLGLAVARSLGIPLALCRFRNRASDGPAVCVHYPTPSGEARAMYMGTKQITHGDRVLVVDDFMRGGSTAAGMCQVIGEFGAEIAGIGAFILADEPAKKAVPGCRGLLRLTAQRTLEICDVSAKSS